MPANPLIEVSNLPNQAPKFADIAERDYLAAFAAAIDHAKTAYDNLKRAVGDPDFETTVVAMETAEDLLDQVASVFYNQLSAVGGDALHELAQEVGPLVANFASDVLHDEVLFAELKAVFDKRHTLTLTTEQMTLLEERYKDFVRGGALLDEGSKQRLRQIDEALSKLGPSFMNNTKKSAECFRLTITDEVDLAGLPESAVRAARHAALETLKDTGEGKWLFTLDYPSYTPFIQYADNRLLREKVWRAFNSRAFGDAFDNCENILKIVALKDERAKLLGYPSHAHYVLERRMAKEPETVYAFLDKLKIAYYPAAQRDLQRLQDFAKEIGGPDELKPWDIEYYGEKLKQKLFDFSVEDLRPYFQLDKVLAGCFEHFSMLFDLRFAPAEGYQVWNEDVKVVELFDKNTDTFVGTLFGDFFPRPGKKDGAWMTAYRAQGLFRGRIERPVIAIVCNFTKPAAQKPSLITHDEVLTLFHEMGHAIHGLLSDVTYRSLSGTSVLWDFVELPSQVQENWCYEKETLDLFGAHYETGEQLPVELIDKLRAAKNFMGGWRGLRQVNFAMIDMAWHTADPGSIESAAGFEDEAAKETSLFPREAGPFSCAFNHIFAGGYSAGYYSYKWAEVLDADTFELFLERGLYDHATAQAFRKQILSKGGSQHPSILYRNFRGRDADPDALIRREGLAGA